MSTGYGPSFTAAKLYRKTSKTGGTYFAGRMGGVKVALLKSKDATDDGEEIWNLVFSEATPYQPRDAGSADGTKSSTSDTSDKPAPRRSYDSSQARRAYASPLQIGDRPAGPRAPLPEHYIAIPTFDEAMP